MRLPILLAVALSCASSMHAETSAAWEAHQLKRDIESSIQTRVLDPMLGRRHASVFLDLDVELEIKRQSNTRSGTGDSLRRMTKPPATAGAAEGGDGATRIQHATQSKADEESATSARWVPKRVVITILHDDSLPAGRVMKLTLRSGAYIG